MMENRLVAKRLFIVVHSKSIIITLKTFNAFFVVVGVFVANKFIVKHFRR